jgi:hypothetical protein
VPVALRALSEQFERRNAALPSLSIPWLEDDARPPLIAVTTYESPTILELLLRIDAQSAVTTPVRSFGLLSAMALACHQHRRDDDYRRRIAQLEQRLASVRTLQDAKALLMQVHGISEEEVYQQIRSQAMEKRIAIHQLAEQIVQAHALLKRPGQASRGLPGRAARPSAGSGPACTGTCRLRCGDARRAPARTARSR